MGARAGFMGRCSIPEPDLKLFNQRVVRLLNVGGMMQIEKVNICHNTLWLLHPVEYMENTNCIEFSYNYFEDDCWETVEYYTDTGSLMSEKIGGCEFSCVIGAAYMLYELYSKEYGLAIDEGGIIPADSTIGWINQLFHTEHTLGKRADLWNIVEDYAFKNLNREVDTRDLKKLIPERYLYGIGGMELADIMYAYFGTSHLYSIDLREGTYPYHILTCRKALETYFEVSSESASILQLLKQDYETRKNTDDPRLQKIAQMTLTLPARVFVYLTCEIRKMAFWEEWEKLYEDVYHDEIPQVYVSSSLQEERKQIIEEVIKPVRTADYLNDNSYYPDDEEQPDELKDVPHYMLTDADRLYWWDGSDEVIINEDTDAWLQGLVNDYRQILAVVEEQQKGCTMQEFIKVLADLDAYYKDIMPFDSMFYDFIANLNQMEYTAAVNLLRKTGNDPKNKEAGKLIRYEKQGCRYNRNVIHNIGREHIRRLLSVMANKKLRFRYFEF